MTLFDYMAKRSLTDDQMARLLGDCSPGAVKKWRYRERIPRPEFLIRIKEATKGKVTLEDFMREPAENV